MTNDKRNPNDQSPNDFVLFGLRACRGLNGPIGPDYNIQRSTNLTDWQLVFSTNSPALPFDWTDPSTASSPAQFYRVLLSP